MGKSSVEHQIPSSPASSSKEAENNNNNGGGGGGSASTGAHDPQSLSLTSAATTTASSAVTNASRDVFQGLFTDLGKQAMSMEAILRRICGKVDSMESWMTEISFGMTELDLKLRNIAHNIEGTAANVDDEAANVHRWAAPPPPDDRAQVTATVKKKLGTNKKGMKVTGMVASIIDALGTPADERGKVLDSLASASATAAAVLASSVVGVAVAHKKKSSVMNAVKKAHKRKTGQQHHEKLEAKEGVSGADKVKEEPSDTAISVDKAEPEVPRSDSETPTKPTVPSLAEQKHEDGDQMEEKQGSTERSLDSNRSSGSEGGGGEGAATDRNVDQDSKETTELANVVEEKKPDQHVLGGADDGKSQKTVETAAVEKETEQGSNAENVTEPAVAKKTDSQQQQAPPTVHQPLSQQESSSSSSSDSQAALTEAEITTVQSVGVATTPPISEPTPQTVEANAGQQSTPKLQPIPSQRAKTSASGGYLPPPPQGASELPRFQLSSSVQPAITAANSVVAPPTVALQPEHSSFSSSPAKIAKKKPSKKQVVVDSTSESIAPLGKSNSRRAIKAAPEALGAARRASSQRRSSKILSTKSKTALIDDDDPAKVDASDARANVGTPSPLPEDKGTEADDETIASQNPTEARNENDQDQEPKEDADEDSVDNGDSSEGASGSDSSSSGASGSDNQDDDDEEDEDADNASAKDAACKMSKMPGAMTHTITALKKLKKANMLTPEEEEELKQRAQEKWFKLKGHVKEKKKKDVANILLKRKKNVFTVSARIELLEEKSKEVYASIKQLNNDLKTKVDVSAHDTLRRQVHDINQSLQALDHRLSHGATPAMEKVLQLSKEVEGVRTSFAQQLLFVNGDIAATKLKLATAGDEHRNQLEFLDQSFQQQVAKLSEEHDARLKSLPDHATAIEGLKRMLRRKADLKLLKELETRLLGQDAESEDCLVRCLSCHKEVVNTANANPDADSGASDAADDSGLHLRKVNPGPSSGKIYRSNVPFSAQLMGAYETIPEDSTQSAGDSYFSAAPSPSVPKSAIRREEPKAIAPISSIQIKASRTAMLSLDRPISAPAAALKKKTPTYLKTKEKPQAAATPPPK